MTPRIEVDYSDLKRGIRKLQDSGLKEALVTANKSLAAEVVKRALPKVPVRTGRLKRSVRGLGNLSGAVGKAGGAAVPYAAAVHWGQARPFLQAAAQDLERDVADRYMAEIDRLLNIIRS